MSDRVSESRRAAQLACHYRDQEDLTIPEIARRLGRAEATVKAYLYDPSYANKRPEDRPTLADALSSFSRSAARI
jgi:transposase